MKLMMVKIIIYYDFPESVYFTIEHITKFPTEIYANGCYNKSIPFTEKMPTNKVYLSYGYCR